MLLLDACTIDMPLGGKASSLAKLKQAGFNVPDAFIILPDETPSEAQISEMCKKLGGQNFAIRSSASLEDGESHSFAGQFDTFLNVTKKDIYRKVLQCRESVNNAKLTSYLSSIGTDVSEIYLTVIVQKMVLARVAGVLFSVNPVTGDDDVVVEAVRGLGESLVSGKVTPDTYIIRRDGVSNSSQVLKQPILKELELHQILDVGLAIEKLWGKPVDIEWAFEEGELKILQARPITTLKKDKL